MDIKARKEAAEVVRQFISGRITNFDFEKKMPPTDDWGVHAIEDSLWYVYDDFIRHRLAGDWKLPEEVKSRMTRWVIFLHSEEEYRWPRIGCPGLRPSKHGLVSRLFSGPRREREFMQSGDYDVWPFVSREQFRGAKENPVLLAGCDRGERRQNTGGQP